ncbi:MarR family transcriptional regulator, partial [Pediococcus acidilactici]
MHKKDPFSQFRDFINLMENRVHALAESYGVENLAGPQGFAVLYLRDNPDKEIYIKDIEKRLRISK